MQAALSCRAVAPRVYRRNLTCKKTVMSGTVRTDSLILLRFRSSSSAFVVLWWERFWCEAGAVSLVLPKSWSVPFTHSNARRYRSARGAFSYGTKQQGCSARSGHYGRQFLPIYRVGCAFWARNCAGVTPTALRKALVKFACDEKPAAKAISQI